MPRGENEKWTVDDAESTTLELSVYGKNKSELVRHLDFHDVAEEFL